jgi:hypothetical protein
LLVLRLVIVLLGSGLGSILCLSSVFFIVLGFTAMDKTCYDSYDSSLWSVPLNSVRRCQFMGPDVECSPVNL